MRRLCPLLLLAACSASVVAPTDIPIRCGARGECPAPLVCAVAAQRCVEADALDTTPPALLAPPVVDPPLARAGVELTVQVSVDERLAEPPTLTFDAAGESRAFSLDDTDGDAFTFTYLPIGVEAEGPLTASLHVVDEAGNAADLPIVGPTLDFTPPAATPIVWDAGGRQSARPGDEVGYSAVVETGAELVSVSLLRLDAYLFADLTASTTAAAGAISGSVVVPNLAGVRLEVRLRDAAGNVTPEGALRSEPLLIDAEPPAGGTIAFTAAAVTSQSVQLLVTGAEAEAIRLTGGVLEAGEWITATLPGVVDVTLTTVPGVKTVTAELRDAAWNVAPVVDPASILFDPSDDHSAPQVVSAAAESGTVARLFFSEGLDVASAEDPAAYVVQPALDVTGATYEAATHSVALSTAESQYPGRLYVVTVAGVEDVFGNLVDPDADAADFTGFGTVTPPELLSPGQGEILIDDGTHEVTLVWAERVGTTFYTVELFTNAGATVPVTGFAGGVPTGDTFKTVGLEPGRTYWWRVSTDLTESGVVGETGSFALLDGAVHVHCGEAESCGAGLGHGTKNLPLRSIDEALAFATPLGWAVKVAERGGSAAYDESLVVGGGVTLLGGYVAPDFDDPVDPSLDPTIIASDLLYTVLIADVTAAAPTLVEGFAVHAGSYGPTHAVHVERCDDGLVLSELDLYGAMNVENVAESYALSMRDSGASPATAPLVASTVVHGSSGGGGGGAVLLIESSPTLSDCEIHGGARDGGGFTSRGVVSIDGAPRIVDTLITNDPVVSQNASSGARGVELSVSDPTVTPATRIERTRVLMRGAGGCPFVSGITSNGNLEVVNSVVNIGVGQGVGFAAGAPATHTTDVLLSSSLVVTSPFCNDGASAVAIGAGAKARIVNTLMVCDWEWWAQQTDSAALEDDGGDITSLQNSVLTGCNAVFKRGATTYSTDVELNTAALIVDTGTPLAGAALGNYGPETVADRAAIAFENFGARDFRLKDTSPAEVRDGGKDAAAETCGSALDEPCGEVTLDLAEQPRPGGDGQTSIGPYEHD